MKRIAVPFLAIFLMLACSSARQAPAAKAGPSPTRDTVPGEAEISFPSETYDAGKVIPGTLVRHTFVFRNIGKAPLTVTDVKTACSCTVPKWTTTPVMPGDSGTISVVFDTKGYYGHFGKWMTVYATGKRPTAVLYLIGNIESPPELTPGNEKH